LLAENESRDEQLPDVQSDRSGPALAARRTVCRSRLSLIIGEFLPAQPPRRSCSFCH
jgi:hypothetical protein